MGWNVSVKIDEEINTESIVDFDLPYDSDCMDNLLEMRETKSYSDEYEWDMHITTTVECVKKAFADYEQVSKLDIYNNDTIVCVIQSC